MKIFSKSLLLFALLITLNASLNAQIRNNDKLAEKLVLVPDVNPDGSSGSVILRVADTMPAFNGDLGLFFRNELKYPDSSIARNEEGRSIVEFVVSETGTISTSRIARSSGYALLDSEALRVVNTMPDWLPGKQDGKAVSVFFTLPVKFKLDKAEDSREATQSNNIVDDEKYTFDREPYFLGDITSFISSNLKYPPNAKSKAKQGEVLVQFSISETGIVSGAQVIKSSDLEEFDQEALRIIKLMEGEAFFSPRIQNGKQEATIYTLPVRFVYNGTPVSLFTMAERQRIGGWDRVTEMSDMGRIFFVNGTVAYTIVDKFPEYKYDLSSFLVKNLRYPDKAMNKGHHGKVETSIVISEDGQPLHVGITKSSGYTELDMEAIRVVRLLYYWTPAVKDGKAVNVFFTLPVTFKLDSQDFDATEKKFSKAEADSIFRDEEMPRFMGDIGDFLANNMKYPDSARVHSHEGRVIVQFVINEEGQISSPKAIRSSGFDLLDKEAIRIVSVMPRWTPGTQDGKFVSVYFTIPISFKLD